MKFAQNCSRLTLLIAGALCSGCFEHGPEETVPTIESFLSLYDEGSEVLIGALRELPDADRIVTIDMLLSNTPGLSVWDLCAGITDEVALLNCESRILRVRERPHLWGNSAPNDRGVNMSASSPVLERAAPGPGQTSVQLGDVTSMFSDLSPALSSCGTGNYDCRITEAVNVITPDDSLAAGGLCLTISSQRWREECFFRVAEATALLTSRRKTALRDGIELCLMAGEFKNHCAEQVFVFSAALAAPLFAQEADWQQAIEQLSELREAWSARTESLGADIEQRLWSVLGPRSIFISERLCGDPLDWLPDTAIPHFRGAIAFRFVADTLSSGRPPGESREDLQWWIDGVRGVLSERCAGEGSLLQEYMGRRSVQDYWPDDGPGDDSIPAVIFMNGARRPYDDVNPEIDEIIVTLESLARFEAVPDSLLLSVSDHESELLRWTVNRLQAKRNTRRR
tara:strand:- start:13 stop:1374 length:1362 start_codon:yes stop_codon:yes gene_type:complete